MSCMVNDVFGLTLPQSKAQIVGRAWCTTKNKNQQVRIPRHAHLPSLAPLRSRQRTILPANEGTKFSLLLYRGSALATKATSQYHGAFHALAPAWANGTPDPPAADTPSTVYLDRNTHNTRRPYYNQIMTLIAQCP